MLNLSFKNKILIYVTSILILSVIVGLGIWRNADLNSKAENKKKEEQKIVFEKQQKEELEKKAIDEAKKKEQKQIDLAEFLTGKTYSLTKISLLNPSFVFSTGKLTFAQLGTFSLELQGLDLATLEKPELKVGNAYPTVSAVVSGVGFPSKEGSMYDFSITNLQLQFFNGANPLDSTSISVITQKLAKIGIDIPTARIQNPVLVNAELKTIATDISVNSIPSSKYLLNFEGSLLPNAKLS